MTLSNERPGQNQTILRQLLEALEARRRKGAGLDELTTGLGGEADAEDVAAALRELERRGEVVEWNRRWYALRYTDWVAGRIEMLRGGRALVRSGERDEAGLLGSARAT